VLIKPDASVPSPKRVSKVQEVWSGGVVGEVD